MELVIWQQNNNNNIGAMAEKDDWVDETISILFKKRLKVSLTYR